MMIFNLGRACDAVTRYFWEDPPVSKNGQTEKKTKIIGSKTPTLDKIERFKAIRLSIDHNIQRLEIKYPDGRSAFVQLEFDDPEVIKIYSNSLIDGSPIINLRVGK